MKHPNLCETRRTIFVLNFKITKVTQLSNHSGCTHNLGSNILSWDILWKYWFCSFQVIKFCKLICFIFLTGKYTSLCDVWSYGVLTWEIFSKGENPYPGLSNSEARTKIDLGRITVTYFVFRLIFVDNVDFMCPIWCNFAQVTECQPPKVLPKKFTD